MFPDSVDGMERRPQFFEFDDEYVCSLSRSMTSPNGLQSEANMTGSGSSLTETDVNISPYDTNEGNCNKEEDEIEIPPMIVIENIDCENQTSQKRLDSENQSKTNNSEITSTSDPGSPRGQSVRHIEATPKFAAALSLKRQGENDRTLAEIFS